MQTKRFRVLLPLVQCPLAVLFGGVGLWQRSAILSRPFFDGALWDTTARYHVWPWPFKLAVVMNTPAFLCWALVSGPLSQRWPMAPEAAMAAPSLLFVALLWFAVGRWIDRHWSWVERSATRWVWGFLLGFTLLSAAGASVASTTFYLLWGVCLWLVAGCAITFWSLHRRLSLRAASGERSQLL